MGRVPAPLHVANEVLAFVLEVTALGVLAWWGFAAGGSAPLRILLGLGAPLGAAVLWGLFAAPRARFTVPLAAVLVVKALVFGAAAAALYALGRPVLATLFAVVVVANTALATVDRNARMHRGPGAGSPSV